MLIFFTLHENQLASWGGGGGGGGGGVVFLFGFSSFFFSNRFAIWQAVIISIRGDNSSAGCKLLFFLRKEQNNNIALNNLQDSSLRIKTATDSCF